MWSEIRPAVAALVGFTLLTGVAYPLAVTFIAQAFMPGKANGSLIVEEVWGTARVEEGSLPAAAEGMAHALLMEAYASQALGGKAIGSALIGQPFSDPRYFWGRPSATGPTPYNGAASSGSNLGPTNPALMEVVKGRVEALRKADPGNDAPVPVDLVTTSGSGLDPHISPAAAEYQVARVARARGLDAAVVRQLVAAHTEGRQFGLLGEPTVNVLQLNLALDAAR